MADRIDPSSNARGRPSAARVAAWALLLLAVGPLAAPAAPPVQIPRAQIVEVKPAFRLQGSARFPGAGVRSFRDPEPENSGSERFEIRWYAHPPGVPPGTVLLLETVPERGAAIHNHVLRTAGRSEGYVRSVIDRPAADVRRTGRTLKWRVRIVWRGRVLASRTSGNWTR